MDIELFEHEILFTFFYLLLFKYLYADVCYMYMY